MECECVCKRDKQTNNVLTPLILCNLTYSLIVICVNVLMTISMEPSA